MIKDLSNTLDSLGIKKADAVFVHSDLSNFKKLNLDFWSLSNSIFNIILEIVGKEGAILAPTFTYNNFNKKKIFNNKKTYSETGMFSELLRTKKGSIRSNHPIFSISSHGEKSELFVRNNSLNSTGIGTPFERLFHFNAKILHLNLELVTRCTYLHYIEEKCNVPYRYSKYFEYQIIDHNNSKQNLLFENFVRKTESLKFPNYSKKLQNMLILNKITKKKIFKKNLITVTECQKLFNFISNKMKKDKFILFENSF
jgi:aminoglycoside 3-N-acetyltransferase